MIYYKEYKNHNPIVIGRKNNKIDSSIYTFDIETTSYIKLYGKQYNSKAYENFTDKQKEDSEFYSIMYIWMFGINNTVYYGRNWKELKELLSMIEKNSPDKKILFIHNLSWEFQFLRSQFDFSDVFARTKRKVMKCKFSDYNFECHCTYMMTNIALEDFTDTFKLNVKKLVGNLDYNIIRTPISILTEKEMSYCENDCLVIYEYIKQEIFEYGRVDRIPITLTGKVRRELKKLIYKDFSYRRKTYKSINTDGHIFNLLGEVFQGGYTHSNYALTDTVLENVDSYDFCSSYPYVMVAYPYPVTEFYPDKIKKENEMFRLFAYLLVVRFYNISCKYWNNFISYSKCRYVKGGKYDNGRIISAKEIEIVLTDIDFRFILETYNCEYEIIESYSSLYGYLPKLLINFILDKYVEKTKLKNVEGEEINYQKSKSLFNSIYGMSVTNEIKNDVIYDNNNGWLEKELTNKEIEEKLLLQKKKSFMNFATGCWVTAYARYNLLSNLIKLDDYVAYCDTDSLKICEGYDKNVIKEYNKKVKDRIKKVSKLLNIPIEKYSPEDIKGEKHLLGVFENETKEGRKHTYDKFITQGAKKYAVLEDGEIKITVAGVPKKKGAKCLNNIEDFRDDLLFPSSITGKQTLIYIDEQQENEVVDYQGNTWVNTDKTGCCLIPCSYVLGKSLDYADLISEESSKRAIYREE